MDKPLVKTLTFGLGEISGYKPRSGKVVPFSEEQRKLIRSVIPKLSAGVAQACNIQIGMEYLNKILDIPKELVEGINHKSNPWLRDKLEYAKILDGRALNQAWKLGTSPEFSGEHGKELLVKGTRQVPMHRTDGTHPIYFAHQGTRIVRHEEAPYLTVSLFTKEWAKENNLPSGWVMFKLKVKPRDKTQLKQLGYIEEGAWKLKNSRIMRSRRKQGPRWIGQVVVEYTPEPFKVLDPETIMGIDLGVSVPACLQINHGGILDKWQMTVGNGREMLNTRNTIRRDIKRIIRALRSKDSPVDGKTKVVLKEKLRDLRKREKRVMKTASRKIAARLADVAKRNGAGTWQLENLSGNMKDSQPWLVRNWAPGMLLDCIRWQAEQIGGELVLVDPAYTSQRCSECGHIARGNRKSRAEFLCMECGYKNHADKNAARNLSIKGIEEIIGKSDKS